MDNQLIHGTVSVNTKNWVVSLRLVASVDIIEILELVGGAGHLDMVWKSVPCVYHSVREKIPPYI